MLSVVSKQYIWLGTLYFYIIFQATLAGIISPYISCWLYWHNLLHVFTISKEKLFAGRKRMCCHFIVTDLFFYFPLFTASIYVIFCLRWKLDLPKFLFFHSILSRFQLSATCHVIYCPFKAVPYLFHDLPEVLLNQQKPWKRLTTTHTHLSAYT